MSLIAQWLMARKKLDSWHFWIAVDLVAIVVYLYKELWVATAAYGLHALEEFMLDWKDWANNVLKLPVDWPIFYVVNALVVVLGIIASIIGSVQTMGQTAKRSIAFAPGRIHSCIQTGRQIPA